ncbi:MAG: hypothetical protein GX647_14035 [Clostridiales bacterium]|jgi:hypothetical protein|nr:hypothetical protein [Clostridiales bacterium]
MSESKARIGPGASTVLMILVVLLMTMLGMLSLISARGDMAMSARTQQMSTEYYNAQTEFGLWISKLDNELLALRRAAGADAEEYAALVSGALALDVGGEAEFTAPVGETRVLHARVKILPPTETDRILILFNRLETVGEGELEEGERWTLIA